MYRYERGSQTGIDKNANGSCYYETENVKLYCSILGPYHSKSSVGTSTSEASFSQRGSRSDNPAWNDSLSNRIKAAILPIVDCKSFTYSQVDVRIYVVFINGRPIDFIDKSQYLAHALYVPCINAVSTALSASCINIFTPVYGASFLIYNECVIYDPTDAEIWSAVESNEEFSLVLASFYINKLNSTIIFTQMIQSGPYDISCLKNNFYEFHHLTEKYLKGRLKDYFDSRNSSKGNNKNSK
ncbi:putative exosome complex component RRP41 [Thelohanellus kitauei]|uniref:Putative exosome complex component RRP41 n=1 Tax=Thelohanellus kitauei TaxID=669202 RepID=A0A0C2N1K6_THEKT|nr:putative exosome complex component RRP41 [Thelohanellus kitauei]